MNLAIWVHMEMSGMEKRKFGDGNKYPNSVKCNHLSLVQIHHVYTYMDARCNNIPLAINDFDVVLLAGKRLELDACVLVVGSDRSIKLLAITTAYKGNQRT